MEKLSSIQLKAIKAFQMAIASKQFALTDAHLLKIAQYTKKFSGNKLTLDWNALGIVGKEAQKEAWEQATTSLRRDARGNLSEIKTRSLSQDFLREFTPANEDHRASIDPNLTAPDNIAAIYERTGEIVHKATLFTSDWSNQEKAVKRADDTLQKMFSYLERVALVLSTEELEEYTARCIKLTNDSKTRSEMYALPKEYTPPRIGELSETPVSALLLNGFIQTDYEVFEDVTTFTRGDEVVKRLGAEKECKDEWNNLSAEEKEAVISTLREYQPFYRIEKRNEWNTRNLAMHIFNRFNILLSPTIMKMLPGPKDSRPNDYN